MYRISWSFVFFIFFIWQNSRAKNTEIKFTNQHPHLLHPVMSSGLKVLYRFLSNRSNKKYQKTEFKNHCENYPTTHCFSHPLYLPPSCSCNFKCKCGLVSTNQQRAIRGFAVSRFSPSSFTLCGWFIFMSLLLSVVRHLKDRRLQVIAKVRVTIRLQGG